MRHPSFSWNDRIGRRVLLLLLLAVVAGGWLLADAPERTFADHNPPGCTADNASLDVQRMLAPGQTGPANGSVVSPGQKLLFIISVSNHNDDGCDMSYAEVHLDLPGADGQPEILGVPHGNRIDLSDQSNCTIIDDGRVLGDFPIADLDICNTVYPPIEYVVDVDPGVTQVRFRAHLIASDGPDDPEHPHDRHAVELAKDLSSVVSSPELLINKTPDNGSIEPGAMASFTIVLTNLGAGVATDVVIDDELPAGYTWTESPEMAACDIAGGTTLHCDVGDMSSGDVFTVTVQTQTDPEDANCLLENIAFAAASNHPEISDPGLIRCSSEKVASITSFFGGDDTISSSNWWGLVAAATSVLALATLAGVTAARRLRTPGRGAQ